MGSHRPATSKPLPRAGATDAPRAMMSPLEPRTHLDATYPLSSVPQLSSNPAAAVKVYLEFRGAPAMPWGTFVTTATPAYDTDGDATTFSDTELARVRQIWSGVAEKYSPFNVDVTTVDPGSYAKGSVVRVVIGGSGSWSGGRYGGYGYVGGFKGADPNTVFVFPDNLGAGTPKYVAEAAAHETGHSFGLNHQSSYNSAGTQTDPYNRGNALVAPIMGSSYLSARGTWNLGPTDQGSTFIQDDMSVISSPYNGFGYRPDDYGGTAATATTLVASAVTPVHVDGVITTTADVDAFRFSTPGGLLSLKADVAQYNAMLDLKLTLTDLTGLTTFASADTSALGESLLADLPPGDYLLSVASHGTYGDVGQYALTGTLAPEPGTLAILLSATGLLLQRRPTHPTRATVGGTGKL